MVRLFKPTFDPFVLNLGVDVTRLGQVKSSSLNYILQRENICAFHPNKGETVKSQRGKKRMN